MTSTNRRALRAVLITSGLMALVAGTWWAVQIWRDRATNTSVASPTPTVAADQDSDGLPDQFETLYQTDPAAADTDTDSTSDLAELLAGRNPTIAGLNDQVKPPTGAEVTDVGTYTNQYLASLPSDIAREQILDPERLKTFVAAHQGAVLPTLPAAAIKTTTAAGKAAISAYLDQISTSHNNQLHAVTNERIEQGLTAYLQTNPAPLNQLVTELDANITTLTTMAAPTEAQELHTTLVAATQALRDNVNLLRTMNEDFVAGLIASANIDRLGTTFQEIAQQVAALETKYGIE